MKLVLFSIKDQALNQENLENYYCLWTDSWGQFHCFLEAEFGATVPKFGNKCKSCNINYAVKMVKQNSIFYTMRCLLAPLCLAQNAKMFDEIYPWCIFRTLCISVCGWKLNQTFPNNIFLNENEKAEYFFAINVVNVWNLPLNHFTTEIFISYLLWMCIFSKFANLKCP